MEPRDLYGLPLERFTPERNALVKTLRAEKRRDEATKVSKLRKPSVAAWTVNQLVRTQPTEIKALFDAGDHLQQAQADLLAQKADTASLRTAVEAERTAVDKLLEKARGFLDPEGHEPTGARLEQVSDTLHAGALDDDARAQLQDGCLTRELRHVGLGGMMATEISTTAPAARRRPPASAAAAADKPDRSAAAKERAKRLKAARQAEADARRQMDRAARALTTAEQGRDRAAGALRDADAALSNARQAADEAARARTHAQAALDQL